MEVREDYKSKILKAYFEESKHNYEIKYAIMA